MTALDILLTFTVPQTVGNGPLSMLWLLPLTVSIAVVYKATKVQRIEPWPFVKDCALLFASVMVFMLVAALVLFAVAYLITA
ncbi:MAG TPA: hypothetical protein ENN81_08830 [Phycisphaerales bacterium]|nr:hypothetical protein [Phycisphaerales bacterium]